MDKDFVDLVVEDKDKSQLEDADLENPCTIRLNNIPMGEQSITT